MDQKKIDRINQLAHKAKEPGGLTEAEQAERAALRREYVDAVVGSLRNELEHTYVVDGQGHKRPLRKRGER